LPGLKFIENNGKIVLENHETVPDLTLLFKTPITDNFVCKIKLETTTPYQIKLSDKRNSCMYIRLISGKNEVIMKRENGALSVKLNDKEMQVSSYDGGTPLMPGYIGLGMRSKHKITLLSFDLQEIKL
jgi:hypothetical protein